MRSAYRLVVVPRRERGGAKQQDQQHRRDARGNRGHGAGCRRDGDEPEQPDRLPGRPRVRTDEKAHDAHEDDHGRSHPEQDPAPARQIGHGVDLGPDGLIDCGPLDPDVGEAL